MRHFGLLTILAGLLLPGWTAAQPAAWEQKLDLHASCTSDAIVAILAIAVGYDGTVYASDQSHLYRSIDGGDSWDQPAFQISYIEGLEPLSDDSLLIGVVGWAEGTSGIYRVSSHGDTWEKTAVEDPVDFITARPDLSVIYAVDWNKGLFVSTDRGQSWTERFEDMIVSDVVAGRYGLDYVNPGTYESQDGLNWAQIPNATHTLYPTEAAGVFLRSGSEGVYRSISNGWTWTLVLEAGGGRFLTNQLGHVLFIEDRGQISVSFDDGLSWIPFAGSLPENCGRITEATLDASGRVWVGTLDGAVFRTSESTVILRNESDELPSGSISAVVYPNPASSYFVLDLESSSPGQRTVELFDALGRSILHRVGWSHSPRIRVDVGDLSLPSGIYFVRVSAGRAHSTIPVTLIPK